MASEITEIKLEAGLDEEQMLALVTAVLCLTDRTNVPPEEALRIVKKFADDGLIKVVQRRTNTGRLEIGFELQME